MGLRFDYGSCSVFNALSHLLMFVVPKISGKKSLQFLHLKNYLAHQSCKIILYSISCLGYFIVRQFGG